MQFAEGHVVHVTHRSAKQNEIVYESLHCSKHRKLEPFDQYLVPHDIVSTVSSVTSTDLEATGFLSPPSSSIARFCHYSCQFCKHCHFCQFYPYCLFSLLYSPRSHGVSPTTRRSHSAEEINVDQMPKFADGFPVVPTLQVD